MVFVKKYSTSPYNFFVKNYINYLLTLFFNGLFQFFNL